MPGKQKNMSKNCILEHDEYPLMKEGGKLLMCVCVSVQSGGHTKPSMLPSHFREEGKPRQKSTWGGVRRTVQVGEGSQCFFPMNENTRR